MGIKGDLWSMDLTQVLQMLSLNQKEGQLVIDVGGGRRRSVLYSRHGITMLPICDLNDEGTLHHVIKRRNIAGGSVLEARKKYERFDKSLVDALKEIGLIKRSWLLPLLAERIQSQLLDLFFLTSGKFEFREEPASRFLTGLDEEERDAFFFPVEEIVMEGSHRLDEWASIREVVPTTDEIYQPVGTSGDQVPGSMPIETAEVLAALNGVRDVNEVVDITQLGLYKVCGHLADLIRDGFIQPVAPRTLVKTAHELFQQGRLDDSLRIFHRLLVLSDGEPEIRLKIALIHERQGEYLQASEHYRALAEHHLREGAIVQCCEYYQTALRLIPTDLDVLGRLIGLYLRYASSFCLESFDVIDGARVLVQIYLEMHEVDKAIDLLQRLIKADIDAHQSRNQLIQLCLKCGRTDEAVEELDHVGKRMLQEGNKIGAVKIYRQILKLDPTRREATQILDEVDEDRLRSRIRRRRRHGLVRSSVYLSVFLASYLYYGDVASRELRAIDVQHYIDTRSFEPARRQLQEFNDRFPFSLASLRARDLLASIDAQDADYQHELEARRSGQEVAEKRNLERAKKLFEKARTDLSRHDFTEALENLQRASQLSAAHPRWQKDVGLARNLQQLTTYHREAAGLREQAEALFQNGQYRQSYDLFLRLYREYRHAEAAHDLQAPVLLESEPSGATVKLNDQLLDGITPLVVRLPVANAVRIAVRRDGYQPVEEEIRADRRSSYLAILPRLPAWTIRTGVPVGSVPGVLESVMVAGGRGGRVVAVDLRREMKLWVEKFTGLNDKSSYPTISPVGIFTGSVDTGLFRLDLRDGQKVWRLKTETFFHSAPLVVGEKVVAGDSSGTLWCVWSGKGNEAWRHDTGAEIAASPVHADGIVYVGNRKGHLFTYALTDGHERQRVQLKGAIRVSPLVVDDVLVVVTDAGMLYALDRRELQIKWTWMVDGSFSAPLVRDGAWVYVTVAEGRLVRFNIQTGQEDDQQFRVDCRLHAAPRVRPDGIYLGGMNGHFYVLDCKDFKTRWSCDLGSPVEGAVVEWNGIIIAATHEGTLYGFPPESPGVPSQKSFEGSELRHR